MIMADSKNIKIEELDTNMKLETTIQKDDIVFYDVRRAPMRLYGLETPKDGEWFRRMPDDVAAAASDGVAHLNTMTAGARVRFSTDSKYIALKVRMPAIHEMYHMARTGSSGFDLYIDTPEGSYFRAVLAPPVTFKSGEFEVITELPGEGYNDYTIHFPLYDRVAEVYVGVQESAKMGSGMEYKYGGKRIVHYGSSITEGGCASRAGMAFSNIISRRFNIDHLNLGFSGNAKGEDAMIDYIASLDPLIFVCDYDYNAPNLEHLEPTHRKLCRVFREKNPDTPMIMVSKPNFIERHDSWTFTSSAPRRAAIFDHYMEFIKAGDKNVYFIDGESIFMGTMYDPNDCTVDGCHPNDLGFYLMAERFGNTIQQILMKTICR